MGSPLTTACILLVMISSCYATDVVRTISHGDCTAYLDNAKNVPALNASIPVVKATVKNWQGILLILGFGGLAIMLALIHRLIRNYIYFDAHLMDTFFDAGGDVSAGMVACSVVTKWAWTASYTWSVYNIVKFGVVGQFWYCAGLIIQPLLFAIVACEIRIKAPGAKTFLQVIYARYGAPAHVVIMLFAVLMNIVMISIVMYEGSNMIHALVMDLRKEIIAVVLALAIAIFTVLGGVGGSLYVAYISSVFIVAMVIFYLVEVFYDPFTRQTAPLGSWKDIYKTVDCFKVDDMAVNDGNGPITFLSKGGMIEGVVLIMSGMSSMFVNQSYWQTSVAAKPTQTVWGFIMAGVLWFALPFGLSYGLGSAYMVWTVSEGVHPVPEQQALEGMMPLYISQRLFSDTGDLLMLVLTTIVVITTVAGEILALSSIIIYDIYQSYIAPFKSSTSSSPTDFQSMSVRTKKAVQNDEYLQYDKRCMMLKHVVVIVLSFLTIPLAVAMFYINVDTMYIYKVLGIVCGCCVLPICFSVAWYRITGLGVSLGAFAGFLAGVVGWLVYASTFDEGLVKFYVNTNRWEPMLTGTLLSFGVGGLVTLIVSLCYGGCDSALDEEEEWEKTRAIDNQLLPWAVKYAPQFKNMKLKGIPHFFAVRRIFKCAEISAYIVGVLLAVVAVLVWPACMLLQEDWTESVYGAWTLLVVIWVGLAALVLCLYPLIAEIVTVCRQSYYNKKWSHDGHGDQLPLEEDRETMSRPERPAAAVIAETTSIKTNDSDFQSTMDSGLDDTSRKDRWKTFIHLD